MSESLQSCKKICWFAVVLEDILIQFSIQGYPIGVRYVWGYDDPKWWWQRSVEFDDILIFISQWVTFGLFEGSLINYFFRQKNNHVEKVAGRARLACARNDQLCLTLWTRACFYPNFKYLTGTVKKVYKHIIHTNIHRFMRTYVHTYT